jgi:hypothetical protein
MHTSVLLSILAVTAHFAVSAPNSLNDYMAGLTWVEPRWVGPLTPGGPEIEIRGHLDQVLDELVKRNPDFKEQFNMTVSVPPPSLARSVEASKRVKRNQVHLSFTVFGHEWR